jgi:hypothetical protein
MSVVSFETSPWLVKPLAVFRVYQLKITLASEKARIACTHRQTVPRVHLQTGKLLVGLSASERTQYLFLERLTIT